MREILFRGKRISNGKWIEGFFVQQKNKCYICANPYQLMDGYSSKNGKHHGFGDFYEVDPETVCQYAYATAIDGKKIFEHDIVKDDGSAIGVVKFGKYGNGPHIGFYLQWFNCDFRQELGFWEGKVKHLGNTFDNPELLKGDAK